MNLQGLLVHGKNALILYISIHSLLHLFYRVKAYTFLKEVTKSSTSFYCHFKTLGTGIYLTLQRLLTVKLYKPVAKELKLQKPKEVAYNKFCVKTYQVPVLFQYDMRGADCHMQYVLCQ